MGRFIWLATLWSCAQSLQAKRTRRYEFPDKKKVESGHSHNLRELIRVAGLDDARVEETRKDPDFGTNWDVVQAWSEQSGTEDIPGKLLTTCLQLLGTGSMELSHG